MASPNAAPTWATQDSEDRELPPVHHKAGNPPPPVVDLQEELDAMAASSAVGSSPVELPYTEGTTNHPSTLTDADRDAEIARNQAAEALNDLANAAVAMSTSATSGLGTSSVPTGSPVNQPSPIPSPTATTATAKTAKQKRRPAALLTPTRQSGPATYQHLTPNLPASSAAGSLSYRSPLIASTHGGADPSSASSSAIITGVGLGSMKSEDLPRDPNMPSGPKTIVNGLSSAGQLAYSSTPSKGDKSTGSEKGRSAYNSPFTNQPFYDFLQHLFSNPAPVFSIPSFQDIPRKYNPATRPKLTFNELYCYTLASSKRSTKQLKEALLDLEPGTIPGKHQAGKAYRTRKRGEAGKSGTAGTDSVNASPGPDAQMDELKEEPDELVVASTSGGDTAIVDGYDGLRDSYAKICLLVNVGRINTTFAFYPAMRTVLRTYHSVPSLQKTLATRKSLQDAPRMKNALKAIRVSNEPVELPTSLSEVLERMHQGQIPPTSVVNLIFLLGLGHEAVTETFFVPSNIIDRHNLLAARATQPGSVNENGKLHILNLFTVINIPSTERARMFLYILYHYLESDTGPNPFEDPERPGQPPLLHVLNDDEYAALGENIDEQEELDWGAEMRERRIESLKELALQKQSSAANTPGALHAHNIASAATSARNSIEPSTFPYRPGGNESFEASISDRHSDVGTDVSSRKRKRYSPLALDGPLSAATTARSMRAGGGGNLSRPSSRPVSPESSRALPHPSHHEAIIAEARSARGSPFLPQDIQSDSRFASRSQSHSQSHSRVSPNAALRGAALPDQDISDYEDEALKAVISRRDRNDPRAMQDDWAHGVDISGLDEETVRLLIHQVNLEFGDPPAPEPEIIWKESEKGSHSEYYCSATLSSYVKNIS
ncbi:hypothetical protein QFC19_008023 [Naganishia cerealis]|uniref:Uncharacterized protein n=1 Tax=Naganishia cerealis TaxID=610337 RepID=A0ACC2V4Y4_9TREE|nr:hypothetical protein QFC19_008023 [Naganishia cerealis]